MSVYRPAKSRFYQYDFQYKGKRYTGSTGVATMRKAEDVERKVRADVALGLYDDQAGMTLDEAAGQWWEEVGTVAKHYGRFLPKDKAALAAKILNKAWEDA